MKMITLTMALLCFSLSISGNLSTLTIHFDSDDYSIGASENEKIIAFIKSLDLRGDYEFQIFGHTDRDGSDSYNKELSQNRARAVKRAIENCGVSSEYCAIEWFGETKILASEKDAHSKAINRRVEINFRQYYFENVNELIEELSRPTKNKFILDGKAESLITCSEGSRIAVKKNAFLTADSLPFTGHVHLEVTEALTPGQFLRNGLTTVCDERILKSGGMMKIEATDEDGQKLLLKDGNQLSVALPSMGTPLLGFELFVSETGENWTETKEKPLNDYRLDIPERPYLRIEYKRNITAEFDESTKPHKSIEPVYPRQPTKPKWESYQRNVKWHQLFSAKGIRQRAQMNYEDALMRYRKRMVQYEENIAIFDERCSKYPAELELYYERLAEWNQEKALFLKEAESKKRYVIADTTNHDAAMRMYTKKLKEWEALRDKAEAEYLAELDRVGIPEDMNLDYFVFQNTGLGWINCDRFYSVPEEAKMDVYAEVPNRGEYETFLVFHGDRIVLPLEASVNNKYFAKNVPSYLTGTLVSYQVKDGEIFYAESEFNGRSKYALKFNKIKVSALKKKLNALGNEFS